jgi:hypothetical protein
VKNTEKLPKAIVYVDGFNLYRRLVKNTNFKWLNVAAMCDLLLPEVEVIKVKYFSAKVSAPPHDQNQPMRQSIYFRALETDSRIDLIFGHFEHRPKWLPRFPWRYKFNGKPVLKRIYYMKEKGSDVNLAAHLMRDALLNKAEAFIVVTNDSDQVLPLKLLKQETIGMLGIMVPDAAPSKELMKLGLPIMKKIREGVLEACQFPEVLKDKHGEIVKPKSW